MSPIAQVHAGDEVRVFDVESRRPKTAKRTVQLHDTHARLARRF